jgi:intracellular sulfur oxidation DsrE/DsrF family protein
MSNKEQPSDEILNAFVDDELDHEDMLDVQRLIESDADVRRRIDELRSVKSLLKASYPPVTDRDSKMPAETWKLIRYGVAACLLLVVGGIIGTSLSMFNAPGQSQKYDSAKVQIDQKPETVNVLFHINRNDGAGFQQVLNQVESLLTEYAGNLDKLRVEIVANGTGLNLYRADNARFADKIQKLQGRYKNVVFLGCQSAYVRLSREYGQELTLMPEIVMVRLGISHVLQRQRTGWAYIPA